MFLKHIIALLSLTLFSASYAFASCDEVKQSIFSEVRFFQTPVECSFLKDVLEPLGKVGRFFSKKMNILLFVQDRGTNASFDNGQIVWLPKKLYAYDEKSQAVYANIQDLSPILLHEIGHTFLHERIKLEFNNEFGELFSQLQQVSETTFKSTRNGFRASMSTRRAGSHIAYGSDFIKYLQHVVGYTELYADMVSVIYFNDPDVMYKSLSFATHTEKERPFIQARSFSRNHKVPIAADATPHTEFAVVRTYLGRLMKLDLSNASKIAILKSLEDAIIEQIKEELNMKSMPPLASRNANLIKKIQSKMSLE